MRRQNMYDIAIIGGGPAGATAAIYTGRAGVKTLLLYSGAGALEKADVENFYGHEKIEGFKLVDIGLKQAAHAGAKIIKSEATGLSLQDNGTAMIDTTTGKYRARAVILATGATRKTPAIPGIKEGEGRGVSYCAVCDGPFFRGRDVAVIGAGDYALHEARDLQHLAKSVTILTNGEEPTVEFPFPVRTEKISAINGTPVEGITFEDGETLPVAGIFVAVGIAGGVELARKAGALITDGSVQITANCRTSLPNIYAAGDCTGGIRQIAKAVYEGMVAATDAIKVLTPSTPK
jgi:thioredoxin reductase (NADPH)